MNVSSAQSDSPQSNSTSYVDAYSPPTSMPSTMPPTVDPLPAASAPYSPMSSSSSSDTSSYTPPADPASSIAPPSFTASDTTSSTSRPEPTASLTSEQAGESETLEDQNIFFLLGVKDGTDQQKESFLDELQQVIWEDFLEYDVKLLITTDEMIELKKLLDSQTDRDLEKQEKIIVYLEKLIPDLEEIMLEKALELKEEMVRERVSGLRQFYADKPDKLQRVDEAERLMDSGKWYSAAHLMNSLANS